jgi:hypothetical protein
MEPPISFVITSCGRFDLLEDTLSSFFRHNRAPIARYILVEDSGKESVRETLAKCAFQFTILVNNPRLGQLRSIDRAYASVETPFIFHCEDDWRFFRGGFIEESIRILNAFPNVSAVLSRRTGQNPIFDEIFLSSQISQLGDIGFRIMNVERLPPWGGYSFNPSVVRVADYKAIGPFSKFRHEPHISEEFGRRGMAFACLEEPACETIGKGRHVQDPHARQDWRKDFKLMVKARERSFLKVIARLFAPRR